MQPRKLAPLGLLAICLSACSASVSGHADSAAGRGEPSQGIGIQGGASGAEGQGGSAEDPGGQVTLSGVFNARRIGTLHTADGKRLRTGILFRSGSLQDLDSQGCSELGALGLRTIIDLRDQADQSASPDAQCASEGRSLEPVILPKLLPPSADSYLETMVAAEPELGHLFSILSAKDAMPALLHCVIGRDRASLLTGMVLLGIGIPEDTVVRDMVENQDESVEILASYMDKVLARIRDQGGPEAYLLANGVTRASLDALRQASLVGG